MSMYWLLFFMMLGLHSQAAEFTVTTNQDTVDANPADGLCLDANGACSLRAAIMQSNILGTDDLIYLPRGQFTELTLDSDIDTQGTNDLDIWDSVTLSITNPELPIESLNDMYAIFVGSTIGDRVFELHNGENITFKGLYITSGDAENSLSNPGKGGGIYVSEQVTYFRIYNSIITINQARLGAGIYTEAQNTLIETSDISYNTINVPAIAILGAAGPGIYHGGSELTINKSSIHNNLLEQDGFFVAALHLNGEDSQVSILNTLIAENGVYPAFVGGIVSGIYANNVNLRVNNSNFYANNGVGIRFDSDTKHTLTLRNSVLAFNELDNCDDFTGVQDFGESLNPAHIVSSDLSCSLPDFANNIEGVDPQLSEIQGQIQALQLQFFVSQPPAFGSVLIDAGSSLDVNSGHPTACEPTDINGVARPLNGGFADVCDIGIFEYGDLIFLDGFNFSD